MRMLSSPNQLSIAKAFLEFDQAGRMPPLACDDRIVDVMETLVKCTLLVRVECCWFTDWNSERMKSTQAFGGRVNLRR